MPRRIVVWFLAVAACRGPITYTAAGPRYLGTLAPLRDVRAGAPPDTIHVVTFNIKLARCPRVIIAGDLNGRGIGRVFTAQGYAWPTRDEPATVHGWSWDHVFLRGLGTPARKASGVVRENRGASDHRPVW